jgi:hypothetical protein
MVAVATRHYGDRSLALPENFRADRAALLVGQGLREARRIHIEVRARIIVGAGLWYREGHQQDIS